MDSDPSSDAGTDGVVVSGGPGCRVWAAAKDEEGRIRCVVADFPDSKSAHAAGSAAFRIWAFSSLMHGDDAKDNEFMGCGQWPCTPGDPCTTHQLAAVPWWNTGWDKFQRDMARARGAEVGSRVHAAAAESQVSLFPRTDP